MRILGNGTRKLRNRNASDLDFTFSATSKTALISGEATTTTTIKDVVAQTYTSATYDNVASLTLSPVVGSFTDAPSYTCLDTDIATVDANGVISRVGDGIARINCCWSGLTKQISVLVSRTGGGTISTLLNYVSGSLSAHCSAAIDTRIAGKTTAALPLFSTLNHTTPSYIRNTSCWCGDLDLTCISPWNSYGGRNRAGTLISPKHCVFAAHYQIPVGSTIRYVTMDNSVVERTITASAVVSDTDLTIGLLDSDVPSTISFAKVLPSNWASYLPSLSSNYRIPALRTDQEKKALVGDLESAGGCTAPLDTQRLALYEAVVSGDSGSPCFIIINDELVLITTWTAGGGGGGSQIANLQTSINSVMSGYQLTEIDLSGFAAY